MEGHDVILNLKGQNSDSVKSECYQKIHDRVGTLSPRILVLKS